MALNIAPPKRDLPRVTARRFDRNNVLRLCGWGSSAVLAVGALFIAMQASVIVNNGAEVHTTASKPGPIAHVPAAPQKDPEALRLQAEVRALNEDRRRLADRLAGLERQFDEVTGSIRRQPASASQPTSAPAETPRTEAQTPAAPPPAVAAAASTAATPAPAPTPTVAIPTINPLAMPVVTGSIGGWLDNPEADDEPEQPPAVAPKLETREVKPVPLAALPIQEVAPAPVPKPAPRAEYGIDLGGARDMEALRERWSSVKANLGPLLTGLQPIAVRDKKPGNTELRLVVGPMPNLAAARQVCARFAASRVSCRASKFDGDAIVQP